MALSLLCLALVLGTPTVLRYALAGLVAGCAASIKTSGVVLFLPLAVAAFWARPRQAYLMLLVAVCGFAAAFLGSWCVGLALMGKDPSPWFGLTETVRLMKQHAGATSMDNAFTSSWPTWFLPRRPLVLTSSTLGDDVRIATSMGNPLVWWATTLGSWGSVALLGWFGLRPLAERAEAPPGALATLWAFHGRALVLLLSAWFAYLTPWILTRRDAYIYHYLPAYAFGVILLAGLLEWLSRQRPRVVLIALSSVLVASAFYAPVWARLPTTNTGVRARLFLESWR